jgi:hypothetical protein
MARLAACRATVIGSCSSACWLGCAAVWLPDSAPVPYALHAPGLDQKADSHAANLAQRIRPICSHSGAWLWGTLLHALGLAQKAVRATNIYSLHPTGLVHAGNQTGPCCPRPASQTDLTA